MGVVKVNLPTGDICLAVYNRLKAIGLVNDTIGTPNVISAIFSTPLIPEGYYLRLRVYDNSYHYSQLSIAIEIGTVSDGKFTQTGALTNYYNDYNNSRNQLVMFYDLSAPWVLIYDTGYSSRFAYIGTLSTGKRISFGVTNSDKLVSAPMDLDAGTALGGLWTFHRNASYKGYYLEQPLAMIDAGGAIMLDGDEPAAVLGIKTVSVPLDINTPLTELSGAALFGGQYIEGTVMKSQLTTYLKIDI